MLASRWRSALWYCSPPVQKTDVRTGVIVSAAPPAGAAAAEQQPAKRQRAATFNRAPTQVVLLTNMASGGLLCACMIAKLGPAKWRQFAHMIACCAILLCHLCPDKANECLYAGIGASMALHRL